MTRPYYCWFACLSPEAAAWLCGVVDSISGEPTGTDPTTRLAPLVPAGSPPGTAATAWTGGIGFGPQTDALMTAMEQADQLPPGLVYVLCDQTDAGRYEIVRTNHPAGSAFVGLQWWGESMAQALALVGLQRPAGAES